MRSLRTLPITLGIIALGFWAVYTAFLMLDWYLRYPVAGMALRLLVPGAALCNLIGFAVALARARQDGKLALVLGLAFNAVPPLIMAGFLFWLFFGFRM